MNVVRSHSSLYFITRPVFHKLVEVGWRWKAGKGGFDFSLRFMTTGDHAGLRVAVELWGVFFEFNVGDDRHWNYTKGCFYEPGEYERELELPLYDPLETLMLEGLHSPEHELTGADWDAIRREAISLIDDEGNAPTLPPAAR